MNKLNIIIKNRFEFNSQKIDFYYILSTFLYNLNILIELRFEMFLKIKFDIKYYIIKFQTKISYSSIDF